MWKNRLFLSASSLTITNIQEEHFGVFSSTVLINKVPVSETKFRILKVIGKKKTVILHFILTMMLFFCFECEILVHVFPQCVTNK